MQKIAQKHDPFFCNFDERKNAKNSCVLQSRCYNSTRKEQFTRKETIMFNITLTLTDLDADNDFRFLAEEILNQIGDWDLDEADLSRLSRQLWSIHQNFVDNDLINEENEYEYIDPECSELIYWIKKDVRLHQESLDFDWRELEDLMRL